MAAVTRAAEAAETRSTATWWTLSERCPANPYKTGSPPTGKDAEALRLGSNLQRPTNRGRRHIIVSGDPTDRISAAVQMEPGFGARHR